MNKLLLAGIAGATALATAVPAQAHPDWHYAGGCEFAAVSDGTDTPQTHWDGVLLVVATSEAAFGPFAPTASISVECELIINGVRPGSIVASCNTPGVGFVGCFKEISYHASLADSVTMCDIITVNLEVHYGPGC